MKFLLTLFVAVLATPLGLHAQTKVWDYTATNSGVNFYKVNGVLSFPSTNGVSAEAIVDNKHNGMIFWLDQSGNLIRQIKFNDINPTGILAATTNSVTLTGYDWKYTTSIIRTWNSDGTTNSISCTGFYPSPDEVPSAVCDKNFPSSFADPKHLTDYVSQNGFTVWKTNSSNSVTISHYTLP